MADIKLYYFGVRGRAEPMRLAFALSGKKFENVVVEGADWPALKEKTPFGSLPYIEVKGKAYGESKAIASYVAKLCGLNGKTDEDGMVIDACYCLAADLLTSIGKLHFEADEAKKAEGMKTLVEESIPKFFGQFEKLVNADGFVVGKALTMGDLSIYDIVESASGMNKDAISKCPNLQKLQKNVQANANLKAYMASRPKSDL